MPSDWGFCVVEKEYTNTILEAVEKLDDYAHTESIVYYNNSGGYSARIVSSRHFPEKYTYYTGNLGEYFLFSNTQEEIKRIPGIKNILIEKARGWQNNLLPDLWICKFVFLQAVEEYYKDLVFYNN